MGSSGFLLDCISKQCKCKKKNYNFVTDLSFFSSLFCQDLLAHYSQVLWSLITWLAKSWMCRGEISYCDLDCCHRCDILITRHHVLSPVVTASPPHSQAPQPSLVVQSLNVHGLLPSEFFVGAETLHDLCLGLLGCSVSHLLQLLGELLLIPLLWFPTAGLCSWSQHSWHLKSSTWLHFFFSF